ncbi:MAG: phospholipase A, partial [Gammaproteobacteria bacterium]|nr:phospholipase A [Gammaproteobacteria bacterium]
MKLWKECARFFTGLMVAVFLALLLITRPVFAEMPSETFASQLKKCALIAVDEQRLQCYDSITGKQEQPLGYVAPSEDIMTSTIEKPVVEVKPIKPGRGRWLGIKSYRRNYILPVSFNDKVNQVLYNGLGEQFRSDETEVKFQLSFELPVWENILEKNIDLYVAYTQLSFFQAYNDEYSRPFRETVYEPELGFKWTPELSISGWDLESIRLAYNHQSNGRARPLSRSWDRIVGQLKIRRDDISLGVRLWDRIDSIPTDDDNPDIEDYIGNGELFAGYDVGDHRLGLMLRNPFEHEALQLDWTYLF